MPVTISVAGLDPTMSNLGASRFSLNINTLELEVQDCFLIATELGDRKLVRANSDDLRRSQEIDAGIERALAGCSYFFAEIPSGAQSARAATSFGIAVGLMASWSRRVPLIQVMPSETKIAAVGRKTATKAEMIEWATKLYPSVPWSLVDRDSKLKSKGDFHDDNEHMADACAVVHAGLQTDEFKRALSVWRVLRKVE